jgi:ABC-type glutathione transport system ATPase component
MTMELLLDDIEVVYRRRGVETHAVRGVSLHARRGETLAVVGESGSGKTTIAKVAAGLQKATAGTLTWRPNASEPTSAFRGQRVQMVFQHPVQSLDPLWRVRRSVREPLRRAGVPAAEAAPRVAAMLEQVGLDGTMLDRFPRELSGGQAQRVAIARALVGGPEIVVLDEPTASLDQSVRARILALLAALQERTGVGYLLISHDISSVRRLATRIAVMYRGRVVETGPAAAVLDDPRHPYTAALIAAVPVADPRVPWDGARARTPPDPACPVGGPSCDGHGTGLHPVGAAHFVACVAAR